MKNYTTPTFEFVKQNEFIHVFFAVSPVSSIGSMTEDNGSWN